MPINVDTLELSGKLSDELREVLLREFFGDEFGDVDPEAMQIEHDSVAVIDALCAAADDARPETQKKLSDAIVRYLAEQ